MTGSLNIFKKTNIYLATCKSLTGISYINAHTQARAIPTGVFNRAEMFNQN
jgi:hypothetical protein